MINIIKNIIALFIPLVLLCSSAFSASSISNVSGTITQGGTIVVTSSGGFGTGDASPRCFDDFESYPVGNLMDNETPLIGTWTIQDNGGVYNTTIENNYAISGTKSSYADGTAGIYNYQVNGLADTDYVYTSVWMRFTGGTDGVVKMLQWYGTGTPISPNWWPSMFWSAGAGGAAFVQIDTVTQTQFNGATGFSENDWHYVECITRQSTPSGTDGYIVIKNNGVVVHSDTNATTRTTSDTWRAILWFYGIVNSSTSRNWSIDDLYVSDSWARVVIGKQETYSDNTSFQICPASSWGDSSISARVNTGAVTGTAYAFVSDEDGVISDQDGAPGAQGFEITIGGAAPSGVTAVGVNFTGANMN